MTHITGHSLGDGLGRHLPLEGQLVLEALHLLLHLGHIPLLHGVGGVGGSQPEAGWWVGEAKELGLQPPPPPHPQPQDRERFWNLLPIGPYHPLALPEVCSDDVGKGPGQCHRDPLTRPLGLLYPVGLISCRANFPFLAGQMSLRRPSPGFGGQTHACLGRLKKWTPEYPEQPPPSFQP